MNPLVNHSSRPTSGVAASSRSAGVLLGQAVRVMGFLSTARDR